jgi:transposase, IS5 family
MHGNLCDGHTLGPDMEKLTGVEARRIHVDKGYRGHNHTHRLRVWISGQVRRVTASIRREMKRRAAIEPVIGHVKAEHRMDRNYLKGGVGDCINAVSPLPATISACSCDDSRLARSLTEASAWPRWVQEARPQPTH